VIQITPIRVIFLAGVLLVQNIPEIGTIVVAEEITVVRTARAMQRGFIIIGLADSVDCRRLDARLVETWHVNLGLAAAELRIVPIKRLMLRVIKKKIVIGLLARETRRHFIFTVRIVVGLALIAQRCYLVTVSGVAEREIPLELPPGRPETVIAEYVARNALVLETLGSPR